MKKGFALTLLTVAFALAQISTTHATAPVVGDPGDIIVGDLSPGTSGATATCVFVFPDAFNLNDIVTDDTTPDNQIKWSFTGGGKYTINGVAPLDPGLVGLNADDPTSPRASSRIDLNNTDPGGPLVAEDGDPYTVTFRNVDLSPDNTPVAGSGSGIMTSQTEVITLFASDCSTFTARSITVFSGKVTSDSISGSGAEFLQGNDFTVTGANDPIGLWIGGPLAGTGGTSQEEPGGLCMTAPLLGSNAPIWVSPNSYHQITDNAIYGVRLCMTTDQTDGDAIPLFFLVVDNFISSGPSNYYGQENWVLSVDGFAQAIGTTPTYMDFIWAPNAVATPQWSAGAFGDPAADSQNDPRYQFRVLDINPALVNDNDSGTICVASIEIWRIDRDAVQTAAVEFNAPIDSSTHFSPANGEAGQGTANVDNATDSITVSVNTSGTNRITWGYFDSTQATLNAQLNPVQEQGSAQTLYRTRMDIRAATSEADPVDALFVAMDKANNELGVSAFAVSQQDEAIMGAASSPKLTAATYEVYFMNQNPTASAVPDADRLRGLGFAFNTDGLSPASTGADAFVVESFEIDRLVNFMPALP